MSARFYVSDIFFSGAADTVNDLVQITRYAKADYLDLVRDLERHRKHTIFEPQLPLERLSKFLSRSVTTAAITETPNCLTCGVCCANPLIVPVTLSDSVRLNEYWDITEDGSDGEIVIERVLPRDLETGYCLHLGGELKKEIACGIYPDRPRVCHDFEVGSDRCHEYRRMYGVEPQLSEAEQSNEAAKLSVLNSEVITFAAIVVESVSVSMGYSQDDRNRMEYTKKTYLRIVAFLGEDPETEYEVHRYEASKETWFESDLLGMTLLEARQFIESRV